MSNPAFGTAPIKCSKRKCDWKGYETDLLRAAWKTSKCPKCGCETYYFMTESEVKEWERATQAAKQGEVRP